MRRYAYLLLQEEDYKENHKGLVTKDNNQKEGLHGNEVIMNEILENEILENEILENEILENETSENEILVNEVRKNKMPRNETSQDILIVNGTIYNKNIKNKQTELIEEGYTIVTIYSGKKEFTKGLTALLESLVKQ